MTREQAMQRLKEHKILFSHDYGYDETTIQALDKAIKSLDMWEKIVELINTKYGDILKATKYGNKDVEQQSFSYSNVLMYEVADIIEDILDDIEEIKKEIEE